MRWETLDRGRVASGKPCKDTEIYSILRLLTGLAIMALNARYPMDSQAMSTEIQQLSVIQDTGRPKNKTYPSASATSNPSSRSLFTWIGWRKIKPRD